MKVKELIRELQRYPEDLDVTVGKSPTIIVQRYPSYYDGHYARLIGTWPEHTGVTFPKEDHVMITSNDLMDLFFDDPELVAENVPNKVYEENIERYRKLGKEID